MSYDEHKEARLLLEELREDYEDAQDNFQRYFRQWQTVSRERDALRAQVEAVRALHVETEYEFADNYGVSGRFCLSCGERWPCATTSALSSSEPVTAGPENAVVVEEWAVDLGFTIARVEGRDAAERWVQSHRDHPDPDVEQMPVTVRRTVTTTTWLPAGEVTPPAERRDEACPECTRTYIHRLDCSHAARPTTEGGQP